MKSKFLLLLFGFFGMALYGQSSDKLNKFGDTGLGILYDKEVTFDTRLHTNGFSLGMNWGKIKTYYKTSYYHVDIGRLKHIKEFRESRTPGGIGTTGTSNSVVYGKQNDLLVLRGGWGQKRYLSEKAKLQGLAVGYSFEFGPTFGLLKPYYLDLEYDTDRGGTESIRSSEKYTEDNHDIFLDDTKILGATGFQKGLSEISLYPGVHGQIAAHFDWGAFDKIVKVLEVGLMLDVFYKSVPIMVEVEGVENSPVFINLFINLQLGKRK